MLRTELSPSKWLKNFLFFPACPDSLLPPPPPPILPIVHPSSVTDDWIIQRYIKDEDTGKMKLGESIPRRLYFGGRSGDPFVGCWFKKNCGAEPLVAYLIVSRVVPQG